MYPSALKITQFCNQITNNNKIKDFKGARNGLQFRGKTKVKKVGAAVDAGAQVFKQAAQRGIDYLIVHHGIHWSTVSPKNEVKKLRQNSLKKTQISLYSSHLPLDAHPAIGNNALIAQDLGLKVVRWFVDFEGLPIACICRGINRKIQRRRVQTSGSVQGRCRVHTTHSIRLSVHTPGITVTSSSTTRRRGTVINRQVQCTR